MSLNHNACVFGLNPPTNVKIAVPAPSLVPKICVLKSGFSAYFDHEPLKNGVSPSGCGNVVKKLFHLT